MASPWQHCPRPLTTYPAYVCQSTAPPVKKSTYAIDSKHCNLVVWFSLQLALLQRMLNGGSHCNDADSLTQVSKPFLVVHARVHGSLAWLMRGSSAPLPLAAAGAVIES
jgi:hypothetical protein